MNYQGGNANQFLAKDFKYLHPIHQITSAFATPITKMLRNKFAASCVTVHIVRFPTSENIFTSPSLTSSLEFQHYFNESTNY